MHVRFNLLVNASGTSTTVCNYALEQLRKMSNVGAGVTTCSAAPVTVTVTEVTGATTPASADGNPAAQVTVTYVTPVYIPMMGQLPTQLTITKTIQMRLRG